MDLSVQGGGQLLQGQTGGVGRARHGKGSPAQTFRGHLGRYGQASQAARIGRGARLPVSRAKWLPLSALLRQILSACPGSAEVEQQVAGHESAVVPQGEGAGQGAGDRGRLPWSGWRPKPRCEAAERSPVPGFIEGNGPLTMASQLASPGIEAAVRVRVPSPSKPSAFSRAVAAREALARPGAGVRRRAPRTAASLRLLRPR